MGVTTYTEGSVSRLLVKFTIPFLLATALQTLYGAVDVLVVGQFSTAVQQSGVTVGSQCMMIVTNAANGITTGGTVLIGQYVGARLLNRAAHTIGAMIAFFAVAAVATGAAVALCSGGIVSAMQTPAAAVGASCEYIIICACGIPFIVGYNMLAAIMRGLGDSKTPMYVVALACVLNVGLDFLLVAGFNMGAAGAAYATVFSQGVSVVAALIYIRVKGLGLEFKRSFIRFDRELIGKFVRLGFPAMLQQVLVSGSFIVVTAILNTMGVVASASMGVVEKIITFLMLPSIAFGQAVTVMVAQNFGAQQFERGRKAWHTSLIITLAFGAVTCFCANMWPEAFVSLFSKDAEVVAMSAGYLKSHSFDCVLTAVVFSTNGYLVGAGKTLITAVHSLFTAIFVRIPISYLFSLTANGSLYYMGFAAPLASLISALICIIYIKFFWKTTKSVIDDAEPEG